MAAFTLARRICRIMTSAVALAAVSPVAVVELALVELEALAAAVGLVRQGAVLVTEWQRVWLVLLAAPPSVELQK